MCYCLCCSSFQGLQKAFGSCCVCCCRNTQEGAPRMTPLLPSQILSVDGRLFLQTSPSSSIKCEAPTVVLLHMLSHSWAAVSCICSAVFQSLSCTWPPLSQENWADLVGEIASGNFLVQRVVSWGYGTQLQLMVRPTLKISFREAIASPFVLATWTFLRHVHQFLQCLHQGSQHFSRFFLVLLTVTFKLYYLY